MIDRSRLAEAESGLARVEKDVQRLEEVVIPALIDENGTLLSITVLHADYRLKLARQDYFTANQDKVGGATSQPIRTRWAGLGLLHSQSG